MQGFVLIYKTLMIFSALSAASSKNYIFSSDNFSQIQGKPNSLSAHWENPGPFHGLFGALVHLPKNI